MTVPNFSWYQACKHWRESNVAEIASCETQIDLHYLLLDIKSRVERGEEGEGADWWAFHAKKFPDMPRKKAEEILHLDVDKMRSYIDKVRNSKEPTALQAEIMIDLAKAHKNGNAKSERKHQERLRSSWFREEPDLRTNVGKTIKIGELLMEAKHRIETIGVDTETDERLKEIVTEINKLGTTLPQCK